MFTSVLDFFKASWGDSPVAKSLSLWLHNSTPTDLELVGYWILILGFILALCTLALVKNKLSRLIDSISNNLLVISLVIWVLGVVIYVIGFYRDGLTWLSVIPQAIISSFKMFVVSHEFSRVSTFHQDAIYMILFSLVHFAAAFITFMFIFRMIGYKIKSSLKVITYRLFRSEDSVVHLFWGVNEASCLLAEDIRKESKTDIIVFVDIDDECEDNTQRKPTLSQITNTITIKNSEIARLEAIDALVDHCYNGPAALKGGNQADVFERLHLKNIGAIVHKSEKSYFYFLSNDESQNITGALNLQNDKKLCSMGKNRPVIYVHARRNANNEVFDHYSQYDNESQRMKIKIVDSAYLSIRRLKQEDKALPVNCVKFNPTTGLVESGFSALVVGFGGTGQEAFKFLYEYSAFVGPDGKKSPFRCYAIDEKMNKIAGLIREKMPAIGEEELSLIQASVDSVEFWNEIKRIINDLNYVVIALNNDTVGLSLAVNLFKYALQNRSAEEPKLKILVRCYDKSNEERMTKVETNLNNSIEGNNIEIMLYGKQTDLYRCDNILSDKTLKEAKEFNKIYEDSELTAEEQWEVNFGKDEIARLMNDKKMSRYHAIYDINRRIAQNLSNSMHRKTKMTLMGMGKNAKPELLKSYYDYVNSRKKNTTAYLCGKENEELLLNIAKVEHERWIAAHKLLGYTHASESDCVKKHHKNMCLWDELSEQTQSFDCKVVDTTIKMEYEE